MEEMASTKLIRTSWHDFCFKQKLKEIIILSITINKIKSMICHMKIKSFVNQEILHNTEK